MATSVDTIAAGTDHAAFRVFRFAGAAGFFFGAALAAFAEAVPGDAPRAAGLGIGAFAVSAAESPL